MNSQFMNQWMKTADAVLSVMLAEEAVFGDEHRNYFDMVAYDLGLSDMHFPASNGGQLTNQMKTWRAISHLRSQQKAVHQTTVIGDEYGGSIPPEWLAMVITQYSDLLAGDVFRTNAEALKRFGERFLLMRALQFASDDLNTDAKDPDMVIHALMSTLSNRGGGKIEGESADAEAFFDLFAQDPEKRILTKITPIDTWTGGMKRGDVVGIVAPEKSRKTTLALNWALNHIEQGESVAILMLEDTATAIKAKFVSMLAVRWLIREGLYDKADKHNFPMYSGLSAKNLLMTRNGYKKWDATRQRAVDVGLAQFHAMQKRLRVYDRGFHTGNLGNLQSCLRVLMYDKRRYDTSLVVIDHLQRITAPHTTLYDRMSESVNALEEYARKHQTSLLLLSQMNEDAKKAGYDTVAGTKGGGELGAAVNYMLRVSHRYDKEAHVGYMTLNMFLSREGIGGKDEKQTIRVEPTSGLILPDEFSPRKLELPF